MSSIKLRFALGVPLLFAFVATPALAGVSITVEILNNVIGPPNQLAGRIGLLQVVTETDPRLTSELLTRDDAFSKSTSFASADIGTGELKVNTTGFQRTSYSNAFIARATAAMSDTLTIVGPNTSPIEVSFLMTVEGFHSTPAAATGAGRATSNVTGKIGINGLDETADLLKATKYDASGAIIPAESTFFKTNDWAGAMPVAGTTDQYNLLLRYDATITPGTPFTFLNEIKATIAYLPTNDGPPMLSTDIVADFGNTATLTVQLPQNYSLNSQSGLFLAGPVPEPETWAMMLAGLGMVGFLARRRRRVS
jgi:hypothetical protein